MKQKIKRWLVKKVLIRCAIILFAIMAVFKAFSYASSTWECRSQWMDSGMDYRYTLRGGCMVKPDEYWIPSKNYRH